MSSSGIPLGGHVGNEVGRLETVMLHRPGEELRRITPTNMEALLFDELLWVEKAQEEHDRFAEVLVEGGVEVLYVESLLEEVLADEAARSEMIAAVATEQTCGPIAVGAVRDHLTALDVAALVQALFGGVSISDVNMSGGFVAAVSRPTDMLLAPLPNAVFMRDSSAWIGDGVVLSPMNRRVRRRETDLLRLVHTRHPRFAASPIWFGDEAGESFPATFEGGDVLMVGERGVAIGMSERTTAQGIEILATRLFAARAVDRVLAVDLPKVRAAMHLDTVVTMVDVDAFITYPIIMRDVQCHELTPSGDGGISVRQSADLMRGLAWAAGLDHVRAIEPSLNATRAEREQWNDANNTLAIRPGEVIAYERNVATNEILHDAGITVRTIPSYELPRGRGGPRCMSCPVRRAPLS